jgi:hypothetical protein
LSKKPLIDVEITIATGKYNNNNNIIIHRTGHIQVRDGDDVTQLARNFCKTYSLNDVTKKRLEC